VEGGACPDISGRYKSGGTFDSSLLEIFDQQFGDSSPFFHREKFDSIIEIAKINMDVFQVKVMFNRKYIFGKKLTIGHDFNCENGAFVIGGRSWSGVFGYGMLRIVRGNYYFNKSTANELVAKWVAKFTDLLVVAPLGGGFKERWLIWRPPESDAAQPAQPTHWASPGDYSRFLSLCEHADKGDAMARSLVAEYYRLGWAPVEQETAKAYMWFALAKQSAPIRRKDYRESLDTKLQAIAASMTPEQIAEAERMVTKWRPGQCKAEAAEKAERGDANAQYEMFLYGSTSSSIEEWQWLCRAADQGHETAQTVLAHRLWYGFQSRGNRARAFMWNRLAETAGSESAASLVRDRRGKLTSAQIAEAEQMVKDWEPGQCEAALKDNSASAK
jgi:hypothetical protein